MDEEIPKYKKKKESNKSKSKRKVNHKHDYHPCLLIVSESSKIFKGALYGSSYCVICNKIGNKILSNDSPLTKEKMIQKYKGYPVYIIDDVMDKYLPTKYN